MADTRLIQSLGLDGAEEKKRIWLVGFLVGFVLAMHRTLVRICKRHKEASLDEKWVLLIHSRTALTAYGEKTIAEARARLNVLKADLSAMGRQWEDLSLREQFIEVCSTVQAIESFEYRPGGLPTAVCENLMAAFVPKVFEFVRWLIDD